MSTESLSPLNIGAENREYKISVGRFLILHLLGLTVFLTGYTHTSLIIFILFFYFRIIGVSLSYHRYFSHRVFKTSRVFQFILALWGTSTGQRGPLWWAAGHRHHHKYSDKEGDVHSPHAHPIWYSHIGWVFEESSLATKEEYVKDFSKYKELRFLNKHNYLGVVISYLFLIGLGLFLQKFYPGLETGPWHCLAWGGFLSILASAHVTLGLNSINHIVGTQDFDTDDKSTNIWWLFPFMLGENLHNNHHAYPNSANNALLKGQLDAIYGIIILLEKVGLIWDVKTPKRVSI